MWNPTTSSATASSSDNKQSIKEVVGVDDCKCSSIEQFEQQKQITNSKQTSTFGAQLTGSTQEEEKGDNKKFLDLDEETIDSGIISGQISSTNIDFEEHQEGAVGVSSGDIKKLNISGSLSEQQHHKLQEQHQYIPDFDSGCLTELEDEHSKQSQQQQLDSSTVFPPMLLKNNVDAGMSEWFCNLSLQNNPNNVNATTAAASNSRTNPSMSVAGPGLNNLDAPKQQQQQQPRSSQPKSSSTVPQQITAANAWEKFYQQNDDGDTPLHLACISGFVDVVAALIRMSPHPCLFNIPNDEAQTPLHLATLTAQPKIIRMLLIAGAEPTARDRHGNTALHLACISGEEQCVRALTIPISASEVNEAHRQYGHRANDKSYLKYALLPSDLEIRNYDGERCVHLAAQAGFIDILRILVLYGADINAREGKSGRTPLHIAIECCNEDLANFLLDECQKLNLETATYAGLTAYQVACALNKSEMQNILEKRGAEQLTPPDSDYDSSDIETDLDDSKLYDRFGDPGYFVGYKGGNVMTVA